MKNVNPFPKNPIRLQTYNYGLESILFNFNLLPESAKRGEPYVINNIKIGEINFNPYVYDNYGNKYFYQRELCWNLEDKQQLIQSIYDNIDIGGIVIRKHDIEKLEILANSGESNLSFADIVDGKQRLHTIVEFVNNQFPDSYGNHFEDFDNSAKLELYRSQLLKYSEMVGNDKQTIEQFLKMNKLGVPQSSEHLNNVSGLLKTLDM
jgi:hypothetical protein